jgi:hypothetical protein
VSEGARSRLLGGAQGFGGASRPSRPSCKKRALLVATHLQILWRLNTSAGRISAADVGGLFTVTAQVGGFNPDMANFGTGFITRSVIQQSWDPLTIKSNELLI